MSVVVDIATLGSHASIARGGGAGDQLGWSVSGIGDFNGDGFDDIILGAPFNDAAGGNAGAAYLIYGRPGGFGPIEVDHLQPSDGIEITGSAAVRLAGVSVTGAGDVNGDGFDDIAVLEGEVGLLGYGFFIRTHVIFGGADNPATISLNAPPESSFTVSGPFATYSGKVAGAGDVNGDGFDDFIITGDYGYDGSYVVFGKASAFDDINLNTLGTSGFRIMEDSADLRNVGVNISGAGDVNGDGFDDIILSGQQHGLYGDVWTTTAFVVFGKEDGFGTVNLASLAAADGFVLHGASSYGTGEFEVSGAGDVNGDGFDDILVGSSYDFGNNPGIVYVVFGKATGFGTFDLSNIDGTNGFAVRGSEQAQSGGFTVSSAGDVNGDGFADILIGEPFANSNGSDAGNVYLVFGHAGTFQSFELPSNPDAYVILKGHAAGDLTGFSLSSAGDLNGDGIGDFLVGAASADAPGGDLAGVSYVIYGELTGQTAGGAGNDVLRGGFGDDTLSGLAGNDFLDGGIGADMLDGGADDDRIVYDPSDNPAQVVGGTGTDTLVVHDMAAPTGFGLTAHGFEFAERIQHDPGGNSWSSFVERYNANWQLLSKVTFNDNGTNSWTAFDAGNAQSWDQIGFNYDSIGHQVSQDYRYDDGTRSWAAIDTYDDQPWTQVWFTYDAAGHKISEDYRYDDGGRSWVAFDGGGNKAWDHIWFTYDASGHQTSEDRYNDDGSRTWTAYDASANQAWSRSAFFYDNTGHLFQQVVTWDDGSTSTVLF